MVRTWVRVGEGTVGGGVVREWGYSKLEARVKCGVMFWYRVRVRIRVRVRNKIWKWVAGEGGGGGFVPCLMIRCRIVDPIIARDVFIFDCQPVSKFL